MVSLPGVRTAEASGRRERVHDQLGVDDERVGIRNEPALLAAERSQSGADGAPLNPRKRWLRRGNFLLQKLEALFHGEAPTRQGDRNELGEKLLENLQAPFPPARPSSRYGRRLMRIALSNRVLDHRATNRCYSCEESKTFMPPDCTS